MIFWASLLSDDTGPVFSGDTLRHELQRRAKGHQRGGSESEGLGASGNSYIPTAETTHHATLKYARSDMRSRGLEIGKRG